MWIYECHYHFPALILNILVWWEVCWNLCGMQIHSNHPSSSRMVQKSWFRINSCSPWVSEMRDMSDICIIWNLFMKKLTHLTLPESCICTNFIMDLQCYRIQTLEVSDTIHSYQLASRREGQFSAERCSTCIDFVSGLQVLGRHWLS